jgi:hypothetical protein
MRLSMPLSDIRFLLKKNLCSTWTLGNPVFVSSQSMNSVHILFRSTSYRNIMIESRNRFRKIGKRACRPLVTTSVAVEKDEIMKSDSINKRNHLMVNDLRCHADNVLKSSYKSKEEFEQAATLLLQVTENSEETVHALRSWIPLESASSTIQGLQQPTSMLHCAFLRLISKALALNSSLSISLARRAHSLDMNLTLPLYQGLLEAAVKAESTIPEDNKRHARTRKRNSRKLKSLSTIQEFASAATKLLDTSLDGQFFAGAVVALVEQGSFYEANKLIESMTKRYGVTNFPHGLMVTLLEILHRQLDTAKGVNVLDANELFNTLESLADDYDDDDDDDDDESILGESHDVGISIEVIQHNEKSATKSVQAGKIKDTVKVEKSILLNDILNLIDSIKNTNDLEGDMPPVFLYISMQNLEALSTSKFNLEEDDDTLYDHLHPDVLQLLNMDKNSNLTNLLYPRSDSAQSIPDVTEQLMKFSEETEHRYSSEFESILYKDYFNDDDKH